MEFETEIAREIACKRGRNKGAKRRLLAVSMAALFAVSAFAMVQPARAEYVLLDDLNLGDPLTEDDRISSWSGIWTPISNPVNPTWGSGNWGGFDPADPYPDDYAYSRAHNLRTAWAATEGEEDKGATVTLRSRVSAKLIEIRALDGFADDSFVVKVNGKLAYTYANLYAVETWVTHQIPILGAGTFNVEIIPTGPAWSGVASWGQLGVNYIRLYGVGGFDMYGYNYDSRLYVGWLDYYDRYELGGTGDAWLIMKWSDDWVIQGDCPVGAWVTNILTWFSDDSSPDTWFGYWERGEWNEEVTPTKAFMVQEFVKVVRVGDDPEAWAEYEAGGAIGYWGSYPSGVPAFVMFQDTVRVFDADTGELIDSYEFCLTKPWPLGRPIF